MSASAHILGLITDIGNFSYSEVVSKTFFVGEQLMKLGINLENIHKQLNLSRTSLDLRANGYIQQFYTKREVSLLYFFS